MKYPEKVIVYAVIVHQTNISYLNEVPVCIACIIIWVGRTASVLCPFYSILPGQDTLTVGWLVILMKIIIIHTWSENAFKGTIVKKSIFWLFGELISRPQLGVYWEYLRVYRFIESLFISLFLLKQCQQHFVSKCV